MHADHRGELRASPPGDRSAPRALAADLSQFVKANLSAHAYPRAITFVDQLPKTPAAKCNGSCCGNSREDKYPATSSSRRSG